MPDDGAPGAGSPPPGAPRGEPPVDVALVLESTYPYLRGGVSAVVHDIVRSNPDLTFGVAHLTWDSTCPAEDLYGVPPNVRWVRRRFLSMQEHRAGFLDLRPADLRMRRSGRAALARRLYDALAAIAAGDPAEFWRLHDEGMDPTERSYPLWALLGTREFMAATRDRLAGLGLSLTDTFWLLREFSSLSYAVLGADVPPARVYHAHTTGYASLLAAAAARRHAGTFLLTEHNLYVRDTVNTLRGRDLALPVTARDHLDPALPPRQRAWMSWWIEMGRLCYPSAEAVTYLYPGAVTEAADLGAPLERSVVIPNGVVVEDFAAAAARRRDALPGLLAAQAGTDGHPDGHPDGHRTWRLAHIGRVVPIKGLPDLLEALALLLRGGRTDVHLDVLGPTDHDPAHAQLCRARAAELGLARHVTFHGPVDVRDALGDVDLLVVSSHNEGQPVVVLEAMSAGVPVVGTDVGGMAQLVADPLTTPAGHTWGPCGVLVPPRRPDALAGAVEEVLADPAGYARMARRAQGRVRDFFQLRDAMAAYNRLYRELGGLGAAPPRTLLPAPAGESGTPPGAAALRRAARPRIPGPHAGP
ncbi:GT4 family glycosyltransferase PelF [Kineococcus sp. NUM-3379]